MEPVINDRAPGGKKTFLLMILLTSALVALTIYGNTWKSDRRVAHIVVEGNRIVATKEIVALADVPLHEPLFALDLFAIEQRLLKQPYVRKVSVHRDLPDRIRITIEERQPVALLAQGTLLTLDAEGYVLPAVRSAAAFDLPVISVPVAAKECVIGKQIRNARVREALGIVSLAREVDEEMYRNISEVGGVGTDEFVLYTAEFGVPILLGRERVGVKLLTLSAFWKTVVTRKGANALDSIDLRFEDQVVVRWNHRGLDVHS
ncbi:MAG: hypothetical protein C4326_04575 [Ignavibacteria bacterium]